MVTAASKSQFTPADVLRMEGEQRYELVNGQLVCTDMSGLAAIITAFLVGRLDAFVRSHKLGVVMTSDGSYQCFAVERDRVRRPDLSFISKARMRPEYLEGHIPIPPDLAVEVVSPNDLFYDVQQKVGEYLRAGVRLVWIVNPRTREVHVYRADGEFQLLKIDDALDGADVVPGFRCPLAEIFQDVPTGPS